MDRTTRLTRDCVGTMVPSGRRFELARGEEVAIVQALGGSFTLRTQDGCLVRLAGSDADAIGEKAPERPAETAPAAPLEELVQAELKTVYDPEIPVDIVELGLVYGTEITPLLEGGVKIHVRLTLTAPGCAMGDVIRDEVRDKLSALPGVRLVEVEIVLDPPWDSSRMSEAARLATGIFW